MIETQNSIPKSEEPPSMTVGQELFDAIAKSEPGGSEGAKKIKEIYEKEDTIKFTPETVARKSLLLCLSSTIFKNAVMTNYDKSTLEGIEIRVRDKYRQITDSLNQPETTRPIQAAVARSFEISQGGLF